MAIPTPDDADDPNSPEDDNDETDSPFADESSTGPGREDMASEFIPERDEWKAKTILARNDPARLAAISQWENLFPECAYQQPILDEFVIAFLKSRPSVQGKSRKQFVKVIMSMFGNNDDEDGRNIVLGALADDE